MADGDMASTTLPTTEARHPLSRDFDGMATLAMVPPLWRRRMNPRVREWRRRYDPDITEWGDYNRGSLPLPKGAS